jgi:hypothetical protein
MSKGHLSTTLTTSLPTALVPCSITLVRIGNTVIKASCDRLSDGCRLTIAVAWVFFGPVFGTCSGLLFGFKLGFINLGEAWGCRSVPGLGLFFIKLF